MLHLRSSKLLASLLGTFLLLGARLEAQEVNVQGFDFQGNTQISSDVLGEQLEDFTERSLTFDQLGKAADRLTDFYRKKGFFTVRAALPTQDVKDGIVQFQIIESKLGKITVQGNEKYSTEFVDWFIDPVRQTEFPDRYRVQRQLLLLNEFPDLEVASIVEAGDDPNTVDLILDVTDEHPTHFTVDYNNFGSSFTGRNRVGATLDFGNLSGNGDRLTVRGLRSLASRGVTVGTANYSIPISNTGTRASVLLSNAVYGVGNDLEILDIRGDAIVAGAFINHPFIRQRDWNLDFNGGFIYQDIDDLILDETVSRDRLRELVVGVSSDWGDRYGRNFANARVTQDLGTALGGLSQGDPLSSRQAGGGFTKWNFDLARVHSFNQKWFGVARIGHQVANQPLPTAEQFGLGGIGSVRGFTQAAYLGDGGFNTGFELRWQPIEGKNANLLQMAAFIDHGNAYLKEPAPGEIDNVSLTGAGFGVRLNLPGLTVLRADIGWPVGRNAITDLNGSDPITYLNFSKTF